MIWRVALAATLLVPACGYGQDEPPDVSAAVSGDTSTDAAISAPVAEHLGLDAAMPDLRVTEWPRLADGSFADQPSREFRLSRILRPGWVKVVVLELYNCDKCKTLIEKLAIEGPRQADFIVLGLREPDDHLREDRKTKSALRSGTGWLVIFRADLDEARAMLHRFVPDLVLRTPMVLILDREDRVRAISSIGRDVTFDDTVNWVKQQVRATYRDGQPLASLSIERGVASSPPPPPTPVDRKRPVAAATTTPPPSSSPPQPPSDAAEDRGVFLPLSGLIDPFASDKIDTPEPKAEPKPEPRPRIEPRESKEPPRGKGKRKRKR